MDAIHLFSVVKHSISKILKTRKYIPNLRFPVSGSTASQS